MAVFSLRARRPLLILGLCLSTPVAGWSMFARTWEPVPIERLLKNVGDHVRKHPKDADGVYTLGRIHSLAFAKGAAKADVVLNDWQTRKPRPLPGFPPYDSILVLRDAKKSPDQPALKHLEQSVRLYIQATGMSPKSNLYWLGLGWMEEQAIPFAGRVEAPFLKGGGKATPKRWKEEALAAYRRAHAAALPGDLASQGGLMVADARISVEAGKAIIRLLGTRLTADEKSELAEIKKQMAIIESKPIAVTPIILPLSEAHDLGALTPSYRTTRFDLDGDGEGERWSWPASSAGFLAWDPEGTGKIRSGRQLFGSVTWSMFWSDGYQALAALDNDGDGWLAGTELAGLVVWQDRNGNGQSEPREVLSLASLRIHRIAATARGRIGDTLTNPRGIELQHGKFLPTYDWISAPAEAGAQPLTVTPRKAPR